MRKQFTIPLGALERARMFVALPGRGDIWVNGQKVDGRAGTRSLSQYDVRALYHAYDVKKYLHAGQANVIGVRVGVGWFGHPPLSRPFGPPTLRLLLRVQSNTSTTALSTTALSTTSASKVMEVGTDATWLEADGPVVYEDLYNGSVYDARKETPGWTLPTYDPTAATANWTSVLLCVNQADFQLNNTILSAASFPAVAVIQSRPALSMRMPTPGVYVYDFGQNMPGWCTIRITGKRGLRVQLRHAEVLRHPPYGPADGNVYMANLRTAKATDTYVLKGDPNGEEIDFSTSMHGFRYVEMTFPDSPEQAPPTLDTIAVIQLHVYGKSVCYLTMHTYIYIWEGCSLLYHAYIRMYMGGVFAIMPCMYMRRGVCYYTMHI